MKPISYLLVLGTIILTSCPPPPDPIPQTINVPDDQPSIQAAIDHAIDGDTILVAEGTYYENINFNGKAITIASHYLIDGNESHISKTIIDGSRQSYPETGSVVTLDSDEDTTSVLRGFTIMGGSGSLFVNNNGTQYFGGGGVNIIKTGGRIENNIIEGNHITDPQFDPFFVVGAGINAIVSYNHTAIIRDNIIRNNTYYGNYYGGGGGMNLEGGRFIVEGNTVSGNILNSDKYTKGGGIFYNRWKSMGPVIDEATIRNNIITENEIYGESLGEISYGAGLSITAYPNGAGMVVEGQFEDVIPLVCNNLIANNHAHDGMLGGIAAYDLQEVIFINNTIVNNKAENGPSQIGLANLQAADFSIVKAILLNNIIWSDAENDSCELWLWPEDNILHFTVYNNIKGGWEGEGNIAVNPFFTDNSFSLSDISMCVGAGIKETSRGGIWYKAPDHDLFGNPRPNPIDEFVDLGAIESPYTSNQNNAR